MKRESYLAAHILQILTKKSLIDSRVEQHCHVSPVQGTAFPEKVYFSVKTMVLHRGIVCKFNHGKANAWYTDQWNRSMENPETNLHNYTQVIFLQRCESSSMEKDSLQQKDIYRQNK